MWTRAVSFRGGWSCVSEHDGIKNPLCDLCSSLMSSSGLRQAATPSGFIHSTELFTPPRYPYLWDLESFSCPLCKACYSLRNKSKELCRQTAPSEGVKILWNEDTKRLTLRISLDLRFNSVHYVGCSQEICILADPAERVPAKYGILPLVRDLAGTELMSTAKSLLTKCSKSHKKCHVGVKEPPALPTRVLDLMPDDQMQDNFCRLLANKQHKRDKYACLSYCWGGPDQRQVLLTRGEKDRFVQGIRVQDLGQCIQDAIKAVRMVGIRYLWIDALCIFQDDKDDMTAEMSCMKDIFKNATLVLAAASSSNSNQGFLEPRDVPGESICDFPALVDGRPVKLTLRSIAKYHNGGKHDQVVDLDHPINKRAWTLQECVLARRLLIFSNYEVFWHCQETANRPVLPSYFGQPKELIPWDRTKTIEPLIRPTGTLPQWLPLWFQLVDDYMGRKMAKSCDCLNALQGVMREVETQTGDKFVFGLSTRFFLWSLLWHVPRTQDPRWLDASGEDSTTSAPSWSWATQVWPVTMNLCLGFTPGADVLALHENASGSCGAAVKLRGKLRRGAHTKSRGPGVSWRDPPFDEDFDRDAYMASAFLFYLGHSRELSDSYWIRKGMTAGGENLFEFFLVLERGTSGRFRRTGLSHLGYVGDPRPFPDDWKETTIWVD